eukprot:11514447-Prorocentrum_lima.AAC.1
MGGRPDKGLKQILLLEQQQTQARDASQQLMYECQVYQSCGLQRALENTLLAEQNRQAKTLVKFISGHVRDQQ